MEIQEKTKRLLWRCFLMILFIAMMLLALGSIFSNKYQHLAGQNSILEKELSTRKLEIDKMEKERNSLKDSISIVQKERNKQSELLKQEIAIKKQLQEQLNNRPIFSPKDLQESSDYLNTAYNTKDAVVDSASLKLTQHLSKQVIEDLEKGNKAVALLPLKEEQIKLNEVLISNLEQDKIDCNLLLTSTKDELLKRKKLNIQSEENINNLNKELRTIKNRNTVNKWLIPLGSLLGIFLGTQIAK